MVGFWCTGLLWFGLWLYAKEPWHSAFYIIGKKPRKQNIYPSNGGYKVFKINCTINFKKSGYRLSYRKRRGKFFTKKQACSHIESSRRHQMVLFNMENNENTLLKKFTMFLNLLTVGLSPICSPWLQD